MCSVSVSSTIRTDLLGNLKYDSVALQHLSTSVRQRLADLEVVTFYETSPTPPLGRLVCVHLIPSIRCRLCQFSFSPFQIVDESSSSLGIPHEVLLPLYENHRDMCRFPGQTDGYKLVLYQLREISLKRLTPFQSKECDDTLSSTRCKIW